MEWNNSAIATILILFLIAVAVVFAVIYIALRNYKPYQNWITEAKKKPLLYVLHLMVLFILSFILTVFILIFITFIRGKGLLE